MAEKQRIVALTEQPGASVARVARENGLNANQVYGWKRLKSRGQLGTAAEPQALIAVRLTPEGGPRRTPGRGAGCLELQHARGQLVIEGGADPMLLRIVLEYLVG